MVNNHKMHWNTLFTRKRLGAENRYSATPPDPIRNDYLRDYDRLIFSSAFRRLQNKTQVFPVPGPVFVHNRLTHSLEVASVGRSLGKAVGVKIAEKYPNENEEFREFYRYDLSTVVATACLAHDIGNPPFGHSGEAAIRNYFEQLEGHTLHVLQEGLTENQFNDFRRFEGNANAFRILTNPRNGHHLTYTTIASIVKYPTDSTSGFNKQAKQIGRKKSGFFDSEMDAYKKIANELAIPALTAENNHYARHPFVFLMEAADDICYRVIDLEDAHRLRILSTNQLINLLVPFFENDPRTTPQYLLEDKLPRITDNNEKLSFIRAMLINKLADACAKVFLEKEAELLAGTLNASLIDLLDPHTLQCLQEVDRLSVSDIYNNKGVVEIEVAGFNVIGELLEQFVEAILEPKRAKSQKLLKIVPVQFGITGERENLYADIQGITDYIAGMSDVFAVDLYRRITGISIQPLA